MDASLMWAAGVLSVSGGIQYVSSAKQLLWTVTSTDEILIDKLIETIGVGTKTGPEKGFKTPRYRLNIRNQEVVELFQKLENYLLPHVAAEMRMKIARWQELPRKQLAQPYRLLSDAEIADAAEEMTSRIEWSKWKALCDRLYGSGAVQTVILGTGTEYNDEYDVPALTSLEILDANGQPVLPQIDTLKEFIMQRRNENNEQYRWLLPSSINPDEPDDLHWAVREIAEKEIGIRLPLKQYTYDLRRPPTTYARLYVEAMPNDE